MIIVNPYPTTTIMEADYVKMDRFMLYAEDICKDRAVGLSNYFLNVLGVPDEYIAAVVKEY